VTEGSLNIAGTQINLVFAGGWWIFIGVILGYLLNFYGKKCSSPCYLLCIVIFRNVTLTSEKDLTRLLAI
jgi:hypothetical protein